MPSPAGFGFVGGGGGKPLFGLYIGTLRWRRPSRWGGWRLARWSVLPGCETHPKPIAGDPIVATYLENTSPFALCFGTFLEKSIATSSIENFWEACDPRQSKFLQYSTARSTVYVAFSRAGTAVHDPPLGQLPPNVGFYKIHQKTNPPVFQSFFWDAVLGFSWLWIFLE